jgi:sugar phosphate permease
MIQPGKESYRDPHRWVVFTVICLIYFFVYFHRVSTSVIVFDLLAEFNTTATALGFMSSMYFSSTLSISPSWDICRTASALGR